MYIGNSNVDRSQPFQLRLLYVLGILELMAFPLLGAGTFSMAPDEKRHGCNKSWGPMVCVWRYMEALEKQPPLKLTVRPLDLVGKAGCCFYTTGKVEGATPEIPNGSLGGGKLLLFAGLGWLTVQVVSYLYIANFPTAVPGGQDLEYPSSLLWCHEWCHRHLGLRGKTWTERGGSKSMLVPF